MTEKSERYREVQRNIEAFLSDEGEHHLDDIALMATITSMLAGAFDSFFWTGFYRVRGESLVIGPYAGTPGCIYIPFGKGVCGTAAADGRTVIVPNVHEFPGHIACDARSQSEIVVPVFDRSGTLIAVLDVDSDRLNAFDEADAAGLERICRLFERLD